MTRRWTSVERKAPGKRLLAVVLMAVWLSGCAGSSSVAEPPRQMLVAVAPGPALNETLAMLLEQGYVITQADGELGRIDASLARPPGYRLEVRVEPAGASGASVSLQGYRGGRRLPPAVVEPLFVELQGRLAR